MDNMKDFLITIDELVVERKRYNDSFFDIHKKIIKDIEENKKIKMENLKK